ncbi:MAG: porin [Rhizobacter sp.]
MNRLPANAIAAIVGCLAAQGAMAQNTPSIYGLIDVAAGRFQALGGPGQWQEQGSGLSLSFIGIRGGEDLGGGLRARFGLEAYLGADTGTVGRFAGDAFWSRSAYVGLQGAFGTTLLGRLPTPLWTSTQLFNPFGESLAFSPSMRQYFGGTVLGDSHWNNSVGYSSAEPEGGHGLRYSVQFNAGEGTAGTGKNVGVNVIYTSGPLSATGVWQQVRNSVLPLPPGFDHQNIYQLGASYEFPVVRLYGQAGHASTRATTPATTSLYQFGAAVPVGLGFVIGSYGQAHSESAGTEQTRRTFSLGYDYFLSKNTDVYAVVMNERMTNLSNANTVAAGLRLRF